MTIHDAMAKVLRVVLAALLLSLGCVLGGCDKEPDTQHLAEFTEKLQKLEAAGAHRDEVKAQLGEPSSVFEEQEDGRERWVYYYPYPDQPFKYGAVLTFDSETGSLLRYSNTVAD